LTTAQLLYLRQVWREEGLTQRELSHRVDSAESTTTSAIRILERRGLVFRKALAGDRRASRVFLTKKGRQIEDIVLPTIADVNRVAVEGLSAADVKLFGSVLEKIIANVQDYAAPSGFAEHPKRLALQKTRRRGVSTGA
jgi:DNA-binding MarR family transcriptional regulator